MMTIIRRSRVREAVIRPNPARVQTVVLMKQCHLRHHRSHLHRAHLPALQELYALQQGLPIHQVTAQHMSPVIFHRITPPLAQLQEQKAQRLPSQ